MCDPGLKPCVRNEIRNPITCECAFIKVCEANPFCAKMSPFPECTCVECNKEPCDGGELRAPPECECMPSSQSSTTPSPIIYCDPAPGCGNFLPWPECRCTECTKDLCPNGQPRDLNAFCQCTSEPSIACDPSPDCGKWLGWPDCACETCISDFCEDGQPRYPPPFCNCPLPTESPSETLPSYVCDPIWPPLNNGNQWLPYPDCKWVCSEIILNCQDGQNQDLESCECEPQIVCDPPFGCEKWVGWPDCRCEGCSSDPCENGQPRELPSCECKNYVCDPIWPPSPPGNQWLPYPDCRWFCDLNQLMCTPGFKPDKKTCTCVCEPQDCPCNQVWNKKSCRCECEKVKKCPKNKFWNEGTCKCECRESCRDCTPPQVWNDNDCSCQCPKKRDCKPLMFWNERTCDCECLSKKRHCCENKIWNQKVSLKIFLRENSQIMSRFRGFDLSQESVPSLSLKAWGGLKDYNFLA